MSSGNRMFRPISIGHNDHRFFIRTDWWWKGLRIVPSAALQAKWAIWNVRVPNDNKSVLQGFVDRVRGTR